MQSAGAEFQRAIVPQRFAVFRHRAAVAECVGYEVPSEHVFLHQHRHHATAFRHAQQKKLRRAKFFLLHSAQSALTVEGMTLAEYLTQSGTSQAAFAAAIGKTPGTVSRYLAGTVAPTLDVMAVIYDVTGGAVQPNDWLTVAHPDCTVGGV